MVESKTFPYSTGIGSANWSPPAQTMGAMKSAPVCVGGGDEFKKEIKAQVNQIDHSQNHYLTPEFLLREPHSLEVKRPLKFSDSLCTKIEP